MEFGLEHYGLVGIMIFMIFQYVVKPLMARRNSNGDNSREIYTMLKELHDMHNVRDGEGDLVWWSGKLKRPIEKLTEAMEALTTSLNEKSKGGDHADPD